jgi:hypothetical protein
MMAFDNTREAVPLADGRNVDYVARFEYVGRADYLAKLELALTAPGKLARRDSRSDFGLGKMAALRLAHARELAPAERDLDSVVTVGRLGLYLRHGARPELNHSYREHTSCRVAHLGHAEFSSYES